MLEIGEGVIEVLATSGNNRLGGDDFDQRLIDYIAEDFRKQHGVDLRKDKQASQRLKDAAERAKIELSSKFETEISLPFITATADGPLHLEMTLTRSKFESLVKDLIESTREQVERVIEDSKVQISNINDIILVGGSTRIPYTQNFIKGIFGKEPNKTINPDEAVAVGAAIQGAILSGTSNIDQDLVLVDVTPLTLGVEVMGGLLEPIIERNTSIPIKKSKVFTTAADSQTEVEVGVFQGERSMARDNIFLGSFKLTGIPPAPRGIPQIEVTFDIDSNGIVNVYAKDLKTNNEQSMVVTGRQKMSDDEIKKIIEDSKKYEEQDKKKKEEIQLKNDAEQLCFQMEKLIKDSGDKMSADDRTKLETVVKDLRDAINQNNIQRIKILYDDLQKVSMEIGQRMYQQNDASAGNNNNPSEGKGEEPSEDIGEQNQGGEYIPPEEK